MSNTNMKSVKTAEVTKEHKFGDAHAVHGVTFDGEAVWIASNERLVSVDPDSGAVKQEIPNIRSNAGTAFDGSHLWQIGGEHIRRIDPKSGEVVHTIPAPDLENASGMAWAEDALWVGGHQSKKIFKVAPETGEVLRVIESDRLVTGVTWVDGELWHGTNPEGQPAELRRVDPESGAILDHVQIDDGDYCSGLEADASGQMWCGGKQRVRAVRRPKSS